MKILSFIFSLLHRRRAWIDPAIRNIYPGSPIAGQYVELCKRRYYSQSSLEQKKARKLVPVRYQEKIFLIEERYIKRP